MAKELCVLAYSGGLDTSVAIKWIADTYDVDVIALAVDVGEEKNYEAIRQKAEQVWWMPSRSSSMSSSPVRWQPT